MKWIVQVRIFKKTGLRLRHNEDHTRDTMLLWRCIEGTETLKCKMCTETEQNEFVMEVFIHVWKRVCCSVRGRVPPASHFTLFFFHWKVLNLESSCVCNGGFDSQRGKRKAASDPFMSRTTAHVGHDSQRLTNTPTNRPPPLPPSLPEAARPAGGSEALLIETIYCLSHDALLGRESGGKRRF